jgi:dUTP pyrophosphatase
MNHLNDPFTRSVYTNLKYKYPNSSLNFAILKLSINDNELKKIYTQRIGEYNKKFLSNLFPDAGFDVLVPTQTIFDTEIDTKFIDMSIKTEMLYCDVERDIVSSSGFVVHPRSSISKTPLMLANHTGIIDSGYRGSLIGAFRWLVSSLNEESEYVVEQYTRLLQICHPTLCPIFVVIVDENNLTSTERGDGGFGSTGK